MEKKNRELCQIHSPSSPLRNTYTFTSKIVKYNHTYIDRIFCINLEERNDRWSKIKKHKKIERFDAIRITNSLDQYGLTLNPVDLSSYLYFKINNGAVGCYISHYMLWNKIVNEKIPYALILEDDINIDSVNHLLKSNIILEDLEFIQLSKRVRYNNRFLFDGGESYILSYEGAKKLIDFTHRPYLLSSVVPERFKSVYELHEKGIVKDSALWNHNYSITCAVDKFMGYCCDLSLQEKIRLKNFVYPIIDLDTSTCRLSDINQKSKNAWELSEREILKHVI
jgi:glycosyl transferase family 25